MKKICAVLALSIAFLGSTAAYGGDEFNIDGRKVSLAYHMNGKQLKVSGKVKGGERCKQLNVDIFFDNNKESATAHIEAPIRDYSPSGENFRGATTTYIDKKYKRGWYVSDIYLKCLQ